MIQRNPDKGYFITFEGVEGTGKSTHAQTLEERLRQEGLAAVRSREPGGTPLAEAVRDLVLRSQDPGPESELFLMLAARADHVARLLTPELNAGRVVICDRFAHATVAYQSGGRGLDRPGVEAANRLATGGLTPDRTLLLDAGDQELKRRMTRRASRESLDRIDREQEAFFNRVRETYFTLAGEIPTVSVISTEGPRERVFESIWDVVWPEIRRRREEGALG